jgi:putative transcriptional regulator
MDSLRGKLLIAAPSLLDPNFARTVVLIAEHTDEGAMGLVLNRASETSVADAVPELEAIAGEDLVHVGGPVAPTSVVILGDYQDPEDAGLVVTGGVGLPAADSDLEELLVATRRVRIFAGHAGWGPGQLDAEMEREDWIVAQALPDEIFTEDPDGLWSAVLARKGGQFALVARMPLDPSLN